MDQKKVPDLSHRNDVSQVVLYGVFTDIGRRKVRYAVSLDEEELTVHKISCTVDKQNQLVLHLKDCVGCRAYRGDDKDDTGAYFSAYFYPFKRRWMSSRVSRQRLEQCFWVVSNADPGSNLEEAEKWARVIRERAVRQKCLRTGVLLSDAPRPCRLMILVNPQSGRGQALALYYSHVQHMLTEAGIPHTLVITERQNHARELVKEADLSQWNALVIMSGDGLLFEVVNGLLERADWQEAIRTPLGILPGGSGNALAASIHHYTGAAPVFGEELLLSCSFLLCKGAVSHMDLVSVHLPSGARTYSFLSLAWGFVADVDVESEKYRHMGGARFTVGTLVRLASLRAYRGRLAYLPVAQGDHVKNPSASFRPASPLCRDPPCRHGEQLSFHNSCNSNNSLETPRRETTHARTVSAASGAPTGPTDSLLPPLDQPLPSDWALVPDQDFVLVLAMYQSHLAEDLLAAPGSALSDGAIHLFYVTAGISRGALLRLFLAMETGAHLDMSCQNLVYAKVQALRLEPLSPKGVITVDGEVVEYGSIQAQVHTGLARLITG